MAKQLLKDAGSTATKRLLESFMPQLFSKLDALQHQISDIRKDIGELRTHRDNRFERAQELINELGIRVNSVGAKLDAYVDITKDTRSEVITLIERVVRVEKGLKAKRRRPVEPLQT